MREFLISGYNQDSLYRLLLLKENFFYCIVYDLLVIIEELRDYNWDIIRDYLLKNNYSETVRAEEISLHDYIEMSNLL